MSYDIIYLGSQSKNRQALLQEAGFIFEVLGHQSNEDIERGSLNFFEYVMRIAEHKMAHVELPQPSQKTGDYLFVVTADTLVRAPQQNLEFGKPTDKEDAYRMLRCIRQEPVEVVTGCCVEKKVLIGGAWETDQKALWTQTTMIEFFIEEERLEWYLDHLPAALSSSGAGIIEGFGQLFFKSIQGSYTSVRGLPLYEVTQALKKLGFKF